MGSVNGALNAGVRGRVDRNGRLVEADRQLLDLHIRAGGEAGGALAVPQIAALARLSQRLGILISRSVVAADGANDLDLWVRAQPDGNDVQLTVGGWAQRVAVQPNIADTARETDFLRATSDWLWETDDSLKVVALSASAETVIGSAASAIIGQPFTRIIKLLENEEGALPLVDALAAKIRFANQLAQIRGREARVRLSAMPLFDGVGRFRGFRGGASWLDLPGADEADEAPLAVPDAFAGRLDKALREPLDRIIANAETISAQTEGPLRRDYADYARDIATAGRHLMALVDDLVDLQAIERPDFSPQSDAVDIADIARRAAALLAVRASERGVRIDRPAPDEILMGRGEFRRVLQILVNLIGNAVRYSPSGAMVWLRCEAQDDRAVIVVADQGKGIADSDHGRIFEKFERVDVSEPGGSGLGLYIARRLARAMGGDILVDSAPGQGARFTLILPLA